MKKQNRRDQRNYLKDQGGPNDPNLEQLREEFQYTLNDRDSSVFARATLNHDSRYCVWPNQSPDGRKWNPRMGEGEVFPWEGASDARVNLIDLYVRKHVAFLMVLWSKMRLAVNATEVNDEAFANRTTTYLKWQMYTQMQEARAENELLANYVLERGCGVMGIFWARQRQLMYQELDPEGLVQLCYEKLMGGDQRFAELPQMVFDPSKDEESAMLLSDLLTEPGLERGDQGEAPPTAPLVKVLTEMRANGFARFPRQVVTMNRPKILAYSPNDDIFISPDAYRLEDASVFLVEVMREAKFRAYARDYGWDEQWSEQLVETQRGNTEFGGLLFNQRINRQASWLVPSRGQLDQRKLFLVVDAYRRLSDSNGVPGIYYTVFHPSMTTYNGEPTCGKHELLNYDHGQMPFVLFQQERRSRKIDDARGYGEVASTWQQQIKAEWDGRIDRSSIATLPPSFYPNGQQPDKWGPGVQVPTMSPQAYGFFQVPGDPAASKEVEDSVRHYADEYFGFAVDPENMTDSQAMRQKLADDWMSGQARVATQVLQLCQQFESDDIYFRVVGSSKGQTVHATRKEIEGEFDVQVGFDVANMDNEQKKVKLLLMQQLLSMDINGIVDHNEALAMGFELLDPNAGERLLKPGDNATQAEADDETNVAMKLLLGLQQPVKPGQAYQMRLQVLQNFVQQSQAAQQALQGNPQAQQAMQQRIKDLTFQVQQQQNAVTGRGGPAFPPKPKQLPAPAIET
jgi:hypothetical protein